MAVRLWRFAMIEIDQPPKRTENLKLGSEELDAARSAADPSLRAALFRRAAQHLAAARRFLAKRQ